MTEAEVQDALLLNDRHDQLVIAYHLIIDNKRIWNEGLEELKCGSNAKFFVYFQRGKLKLRTFLLRQVHLIQHFYQ